MLPVPESDAGLNALVLHELTHLLMFEIVARGVGGDSGLPLWVIEGLASYMAGQWSDDKDGLMRDLVASGDVPALSQLTDNGGFANERLNDALGHVAFDYIETRWGPSRIRLFLDALAVERDIDTYESVFEQATARFDEAFRQYVEGRFGSGVRRRPSRCDYFCKTP